MVLTCEGRGGVRPCGRKTPPGGSQARVAIQAKKEPPKGGPSLGRKRPRRAYDRSRTNTIPCTAALSREKGSILCCAATCSAHSACRRAWIMGRQADMLWRTSFRGGAAEPGTGCHGLLREAPRFRLSASAAAGTREGTYNRRPTPDLRRLSLTLKSPASPSECRSRPAGWPCHRSTSSPDRRTTQAWWAWPAPAPPCRDFGP